MPYDKINAELFWPEREENKQTTQMVLKMAAEVAACMLKELRDPKKATSDYLSSKDGQFSWGATTNAEHHASLEKMATNDPAESPFAALTSQMQLFGRILGIHASGVGQAQFNGDFDRDLNDGNEDGPFYKLPENMRNSLIQFALNFAPEMKRRTTKAVKRQRAAKLKKRNILRERKLIAAQSEYASALAYIEMYHSVNGWRTEVQCR